ncbi:Dynamitin-domain-containing protein [Phascolomyces articulosus]|uniref:Dynamitin-domain-containing protein n=1 Tax=Phascolomyces articulosus TaxID=60185 RepID=A0AAD5JXI3_9FUNG|nr:Dynamitin-domain-containing protein [Phascolomyces articulosus]
MASKYSTLPDIDDQPDVFETPDSGDVDQPTTLGDQSSDEDDGNENVVRSRVSVKDASARFKDSIVESSGIDFTDRLTRRKKAMYRSYVRRPAALETSEYELLPKDLELQETSIQKLRRLMFEVQELNEEVEKKKESEAETENVSQADLLSQISFLQSDLTRLGKNLGETQVDESTNYGNRIDEAKRLIKQLEAYKSTASTKENNEENNNNNNESDDTVLIEKNDKGDVLTYELYYTPETAKIHKESKVADIDERIAKLESLVGSSSGHGLDDLPPSLATASLIGSVSKLEQQITILAQPRQLETVARRVKVLISELDRLNELKSGRKDLSLGFGLSSNTSLPGTAGSGGSTSNSANENKEGQGLSSDAEEKVNHLFSSMEKIDPLLNLTPALLTRLKALQSLHTEAATFGRSVKAISEEQTRMTDELKNLGTACELLQKSVQENEDTVNNNIKIIDSRMTELVQRVGALSTAP